MLPSATTRQHFDGHCSLHHVLWRLTQSSGSGSLGERCACATLSPETLPPDWTRLRDQWEFAHASRAILQIIALAALVISILIELPQRVRHTEQG
ncbi:hypothetical protein [Legionella bozemanae]|uniref:hypothetical protein n=1 Tax=Legionella bozemanae TaxID=447 RepID=UPI0007301055|nr:hypothetical protein [Legionella bozemanae]